MATNRPHIEVIPGQPSHPYFTAYHSPDFIAARRRRRIFGVVFLLCAVAGLIYVFARAPVYRSTATLVVSVQSPARPAGEGADTRGMVKHSAATLQRQVLLSRPVLTDLFESTEQQLDLAQAMPGTVSELRDLLEVVAAEDSNVLELRAEGPHRDLLPVLVNNWIDAFMRATVQARETESDATGSLLDEQRKELEQKVADKRQELDVFRKENEIVSMERDENRVLARLKGLTDSLNAAIEQRVAAEAELRTIREALAKGEPIVRPEDGRTLANLEQRAVDLQEQLAQYRLEYTPGYMTLDSKVQAVAKKLELVTDKLEAKRREAVQAAVAEADQAVVKAARAVADIRRQLDDHKQIAAEFTTRFAEHEALAEELAQLESLHRAVKDRLVQVEVVDAHQPAQVAVLERAFLSGAPVRPHYVRDAGIAFAASVLLGFLAVGLHRFFFPPLREPAVAISTNLNGGRTLSQVQVSELPRVQPRAALTEAPPRELSQAELRMLVDKGDPSTRMLIGLLVTGLSIDELMQLRRGDLDVERGLIRVHAPPPRAIPLSAPVKDMVTAWAVSPGDPRDPVWQDAHGAPLSGSDLAALILTTAHDAGLHAPSAVTPHTLRHTGIAFLVRQGLNLAELPKIAGWLSNNELEAYALISPPGAGLTLEQVDTTHPALRNPHQNSSA